MMKDDDFKLLRGFADKRTNERTDICDCRVACATEKEVVILLQPMQVDGQALISLIRAGIQKR